MFWVVLVIFKHKAMVGKVTLKIVTEDFHSPLDLHCTYNDLTEFEVHVHMLDLKEKLPCIHVHAM